MSGEKSCSHPLLQAASRRVHVDSLRVAVRPTSLEKMHTIKLCSRKCLASCWRLQAEHSLEMQLPNCNRLLLGR